MRYYKGIRWISDNEVAYCIFKVADDGEQTELFDEKEGVWISEMGKANGTYKTFENEEELAKDKRFEMSRKITKEEYEMYLDLKEVFKEIWMHGFAGGFPRAGAVWRNVKRMERDACDYLRVMGEE